MSFIPVAHFKVNQEFAEIKFSNSGTLILLKIEKIRVLPKSAEKKIMETEPHL